MTTISRLIAWLLRMLGFRYADTDFTISAGSGNRDQDRTSGEGDVTHASDERSTEEGTKEIRTNPIGVESTWPIIREKPDEGPDTTVNAFQVVGRYPGASHYSNNWTQQFVDAALSYAGVRAFQNDDGVGFQPNFAFIERVYTREDGFIASFYGGPREFWKVGIPMAEKGRGKSYSRIRVKSATDLDAALRALQLSAKAKGLRRS